MSSPLCSELGHTYNHGRRIIPLMKIVHVITSLDDGGAEAVLFRTIQNLPEDEHIVVSLLGLGKYGKLLQSIGIEVIDLEMTTVGRKLTAVFRLTRLLGLIAPDTIQTWMYHADFVGGVAARMAGVNNVVWGLHNSLVSLKGNPWSRFAMIRLNGVLSYLVPDRILCCSESALLAHQSIGYNKRKLVFIPNGYPVDIFRPDENARFAIRAEFGLGETDVVLGMVARLDPQKDHVNLLDALVLLKEAHPFKCLLVGKGLEQNSKLLVEIESRELVQDVILVGPRSDVQGIMNALDICVNASFTESFPNALCEAMACGTPCVVTNVGDSAMIVGDTGWVVPPRSPEKLAAALILAVEALPDPARQDSARQRIVEKFSIEHISRDYRLLWSADIL